MPEETTSDLAAPPSSAAHSLPVVPGYEILDELGRGGMGVVYRARQIKANRIVALKMILAGGHAGEAELTRFRTEAEALARLQHPNIVQVHEVGEHDGLPFFSLEFCPGGSLEKKLSGTPLAPVEAASLVEKLARAMAAAHSRGVIHRDLKPANVLLAEDSTPRITDFGLAKKLDQESGQTRSGAIMGTPSYMAPEQAGGRARELGPLCDIYALGAILYECLTGRPPFRAATPLDTVLQVINEEPVPPSQLQSKTPRDLETICLKCLQKEASKRYASALALAEDLGRYQRGEPIAARPVGRLERGWRWCKRNPAVASLLATVLLVFATGATVSTILALLAERRADEAMEARGAAEQEAEKAKRSEGVAVAARNDLEKANIELSQSRKELLRSNDDLLTSVAHGLLAQLGDPELRALWELASTKEERLRLRFVEEALREPGMTRKLRDWAAYALPAAVGLNGRLRAQVEELLGRHLQDPTLPVEQQEPVALCLAHLGVHDRLLAARAAAILSQAVTRKSNRNFLYPLLTGLSAAVARMEPREAALLLAQALTQTTDASILGPLAQNLAVVADRMEPKEASRTCASAAVTLSLTLSKPGNEPSSRESAAQGVSALVGRLEPKEATGAAATLVQAMTQTTHHSTLQRLAEALSAVAGRLEPKEAAVVCGQAAAAITRVMIMVPKTSYFELGWMSQGLLAVAARMEPREAATVCARAAALLTEAMPSSANQPDNMLVVVQRLAELLVLLEPKEASRASARAAAILLQTTTRTFQPQELNALREGLVAVASFMEPREAAEAAAALTQAMTGKNPPTLRSLVWSLSAVAARMEPREAAATLSGAMNKSTDNDVLASLAKGLSTVVAGLEIQGVGGSRGFPVPSGPLPRVPRPPLPDRRDRPRLKPKEAAVILLQAMNRTTEAVYALNELSRGLSVVAADLEPREAADVAAELTQIQAKSPSALLPVSRALLAVAARMERKEALAVCGQDAAALGQALARASQPFQVESLSQGLFEVAARLEPTEADAICGQAAATLLLAMSKSTETRYLGHWAGSLARVAAGMEPGKAAAVCGEAAATLGQAMTRTTDSNVLPNLAVGLRELAARLEPKEAARAGTTLAQVISKTTDGTALQYLSQSLSAVAARMEPKEAAAVCSQAATALTQVMSKTQQPYQLLSMSVGLSVVAPHMEPGEAAATLLQTMSRTTDGRVLRPLSQGLSEVAARLERRQAGMVCFQAAAILTEALSKTTDGSDLEYLSRGLSALATRTEPRDAAVMLAQALSKARGQGGSRYLTQALLSVIARMEPAEAAAPLTLALTRTTDVYSSTWPDLLRGLPALSHQATPSSVTLCAATTVVGLSIAGSPLPALAYSQPALEPFPPSLPPRALVELLKHPLCVYENRRLVLQHLARHYNRPFADQWEFVEYVHQHKLDLDLTTPPQRPGEMPGGTPP